MVPGRRICSRQAGGCPHAQFHLSVRCLLLFKTCSSSAHRKVQLQVAGLGSFLEKQLGLPPSWLASSHCRVRCCRPREYTSLQLPYIHQGLTPAQLQVLVALSPSQVMLGCIFAEPLSDHNVQVIMSHTCLQQPLPQSRVRPSQTTCAAEISCRAPGC